MTDKVALKEKLKVVIMEHEGEKFDENVFNERFDSFSDSDLKQFQWLFDLIECLDEFKEVFFND